LWLTSCFWWSNQNNNKNIQSTSNLNEEKKEEENSFINIDNETFEKYISKEEIKNFDENINNWDFSKSNETIDLVFEKLIEKKELTPEDKKLKTDLTYIKVWNILNEWNYLYKEKESRKKAIEILESKESFLTDYIDPFYSNYYLWYAKEINRDFSWALFHYNKSLDSRPDISKNSKLRSIILNQIWHVYDLSGDIEKAYKYYLDAYKIDKTNYHCVANIARYFVKKWKYKESIKYFEYWLKTKNKLLKSEIYFSLSTLQFSFYWLKPDIEKSIEYAKKSIELNSNYPMWYTALARGYYMLNDSKYDKLIEENLKKSIELNPNSSESYRYYGLYYLDKKDKINSLKYIDKSSLVIDYDPILMNNDKKFWHFYNDMLKIYIEVTIDDIEWVYKISENINFLFIIKNQLQRKDFWVYRAFRDKQEFINFTKKIN